MKLLFLLLLFSCASHKPEPTPIPEPIVTAPIPLPIDEGMMCEEDVLMMCETQLDACREFVEEQTW